MSEMERPDENARDAFFEQLLTVRMPTAGPALSAQSTETEQVAREAVADLDTARQTAPPVEQMPAAGLAATYPPATEVSGVSGMAHPRVTMPISPEAPQIPQIPQTSPAPERRITSAPTVAPGDAPPAVIAPPIATSRASRTRKRRGITISAFAIIAFVVAMLPVLYIVSSSQPARVSHNNGFAQGANPPPGWHPQNWAPVARQQAELRYVNQVIANMTLDEEIGQMIMLGFIETQMSPTLAYTIKQYHLGSVVLYAWNITGADQVKQLTSQIQAQSDIPLLIATDQEGGGVNRLQAVDGPLPGAGQIGATGNPGYARQRGAEDAQQLYNLGINVNFAPVVDVANTSLGDLGGRTFGSTPQQVTTMAGAYLDGLQASGHVVGTLKHFPGLGAVPADPHKTLYTFDRSKADLERIDWAPYKSLIASGAAQMIMSTHVVLSAIDPTLPASLSKPVLTGVLRNELGYQGVIVTDGIYMGALITSHLSFDQIIVDAIAAGNDIICSTYSIASTAQTVQALKNAVATGKITKARIDDSVRRILLLKLHYGVLTMPQSQG